LGIAAFAGLANAYPELKRWESSTLTANGTAAFAAARSNAQCLTAIANSSSSVDSAVDVYSLLRGGEEAIHKGVPARYVEIAELGRRTEDGNKGVLPSTVPVFFAHSKVRLL
jgi:hypothetical protein